MHVTLEDVLERIKDDPLQHLGGYSPHLVYCYLTGYEWALSSPLVAQQSMQAFGDWFQQTVYSGPQGWQGICELLTDTDDQALDLFFEFRKIAAQNVKPRDSESAGESPEIQRRSIVELIASDAIRNRPAMYFGNYSWTRGMWSMWKGYTVAEKDLSIDASEASRTLDLFQDWVSKRYPFSQTKNWGKVYEFLGLCHNPNALEKFYDDFDLFRSGGEPDARTQRFQEFIDKAIESARKEQNKDRG